MTPPLVVQPTARQPQADALASRQTPNFGALTTGALAGGVPAVLVAAAPPVAAAALSAAAVRRYVLTVRSYLTRLSAARAAALPSAVLEGYRSVAPNAAADAHAPALEQERRLERLYLQRQTKRVVAGVRRAMAQPTEEGRRAALERVGRQEQRIDAEREAAAHQRSAGAAEAAQVRALSPDGAFWLLGRREQHTPDCRAMAGKAWPWEALVAERMIPPVHTGCGCRLVTLWEAFSRGYALQMPVVPPLTNALRAIRAAKALHPHSHGAPATLLEAAWL